MSEVVESKPSEQDTLVLQPPAGSEGQPIREWIDTLLQAAVMAKSKQKKPEEDEVSTTTTTTTTDVETSITAISSSTVAASVSAFSTTDGNDAADATTSESTTETETKKDESPTHPDTKDTSVVLNSDAAKAEEGASASAIKHYRRRRCEVEGCTKFARFNNACSGHGGRRLCAETGCKRVAQFGHKCSAHGGVKLCSVEGCTRAVQSRGCCKTHGGGVRCQHPDCTKGAISKGFCRSHGGGLRCAEQECQKWAQRHGYCVRHSKSAASPKTVPISEPMIDLPTASQHLVPQCMFETMDLSRPLDPVYLAGFAAQCVVPNRLSRFTPESIHLLDSYASHRDTLVDIACKERSSGCYCGNEKARQSVELKFGDFVDYYQAAYRKQSHWLQTVDDLDFYLAQCPIAVPKPDTTCTKAILPAIMNDFCIPECLHEKPVTQVNLWMTVQPSRTTLHYDAYQNVVVVLYGRKTITLYPPSDTAKMHPFPVHTKSVNHSQVNIVQPDFVKHPRFSKASPYKFEVKAGDALVIPEGWWHEVDSDKFTIAVNYWWNGVREQLVADKRMVPYYARVMLEELVKQQCEARLLAFRSSSGADSVESFEDEDRAAAAIVASKDQGGREQVLLSLESDIFVRTQRFLATNHVVEWRRLLANASVDLAAALVRCWESEDLEANFLSELFGALEDDAESIKELIATKQAQFRQECATDMYQSLFE